MDGVSDSRSKDRLLRYLNDGKVKGEKNGNSIFDMVPGLRQLTEILRDPAESCVTQMCGSKGNLYYGSDESYEGSLVLLLTSEKAIEFFRIVTHLTAFTMPFPSSHSPHFWVHCISSVWDKIVLPLAWCFVERNTEDSYLCVLSLLRSHVKLWNFKFVICDPEHALSYKKVFSVDILSSAHQVLHDVLKFTETSVCPGFMRENPPLVYIMKLCCGMQFLPRDSFLQGLDVIRREGIKYGDIVSAHVATLLDYIQMQYINHPENSLTFSVIGCAERTNAARENIQHKMLPKMHSSQRLGTFLRYLVHVAEKAYDHVELIARGERPPASSSILVSSLSDDTQIKVLTQCMLKPTFTQHTTLFNLLEVASKKLYDSSLIA